MQTYNPFPISTPEAEGISSEGIIAFIDAVERPIFQDGSLVLTAQELHSFTLIRHGKLVAEGWWKPFTPNLPHILFSTTKSFTSTAIGFAVSEGRIDLDDRVISFFPEETPPEISENLAEMRIRHLLTMSTGHGKEPLYDVESEKTWVQSFLEEPVVHEPGTFFFYITPASYMLAAILEKVTGQSMADYLQTRLFTPLGISKPTWEVSPQGVTFGGAGLLLTTNELARFGQFYLQKGRWQGRELLPATWIEMATSKQINTESELGNDWLQGYGFQIWRCQHDAYRADGAFGQYCIVMPEQDAVLAINSAVLDMQAVMDLVWQHIYPAMGKELLPPNPMAANSLAEKLAGLTLVPLKSTCFETVASSVSGKTYFLGDNEFTLKSISFEFRPDGAVITAENSLGTTQLTCGNGYWTSGVTTFDGTSDRWAGASGSWTGPATFFIRIHFLTAALKSQQFNKIRWRVLFGLQVTCNFKNDGLVLEAETDISFSTNRWPVITGRAT